MSALADFRVGLEKTALLSATEYERANELAREIDNDPRLRPGQKHWFMEQLKDLLEETLRDAPGWKA